MVFSHLRHESRFISYLKTLGPLPLSVLLVLACAGESKPRQDQVALDSCKAAVERRLKAPGTAKYSGVEVERDSLVERDGGNIFSVSGQVDSENSFGALLRSYFACTVDLQNPSLPVVEDLVSKDQLKVELALLKELGLQRKSYHRKAQAKVRASKQKDMNLEPPDVISYSEFLKLKEGMTLAEVEGIIGSPGAREAKTLKLGSAGMPPIDRNIKYRWENHDGSFLEIAFDNNSAQSLQDEGLW